MTVAVDPCIVLASVGEHCSTLGLEVECGLEHFREHAVEVRNQLDSFRGWSLGVVVHFVDLVELKHHFRFK